MKKFVPLFLVLSLLVACFVIPALAVDDPPFSAQVTGSVDASRKYGGNDTFVLQWQIMANKTGLTLNNTQGLRLVYDNTVLQLIRWNAASDYDDILDTEFTAKSGAGSKYEDYYDPDSVGVFAAKSADGNTGFLSMTLGDSGTKFACPQGTYFPLLGVRFAFREGKSEADLATGSIRVMTLADLVTTNQNSAMLINTDESAGTSYEYLPQKDGIAGNDTLNIPILKYPNSDGPPFSAKAIGTVDTSRKYKENDTLVLQWQIMANKAGLTLNNTQGLRLVYDNTVLQLIRWNAASDYDDILDTELSAKSGAGSKYEDYYDPDSVGVFAAKSVDGNTGFLSMTLGDSGTKYTCPQGTYFPLLGVRFAFREGKSVEDLNPCSIRVMALEDLVFTKQSSAMLINTDEGSGTSYEYLPQQDGNIGISTLECPIVEYPGFDKILNKIDITTPPTKTVYNVGEPLNLAGMVVTATYSNATAKAVTTYTTTPEAGATLNTVGPQIVTVSYTECGVTKETSFTVTVDPIQVILEKIEVTTLPAKTVYIAGETLDLTGIVVTATYSDTTTKAVTGYTTSPAEGTALNTAGAQTVTVSYTDGDVTKTVDFTVTVNPVILDKIEVTTEPAKTAYFVGETLNLTGLVVTATYNNGSTSTVTGYTTTPAAGSALNTAGNQTVTVSYTEGIVTRTTSFTVTVNDVVLDKIEVTTQPAKTVYFVGETLDLAGLVVTATYNDTSAKAVTGYTTTPAAGSALNTAGTQTVTVSYTEGVVTRTTSFTVTVNDVVLDKIEVTTQPAKTVYFIGENLDLAGLVVTATYNDTSAKAVTGYTTTPAAGSALNTAGTQTVTVSYTEGVVTRTTSFTVTVNAAVLDKIEVTAQPAKTVYFVGEALNLAGLVVTATYNDTSTRAVTTYTTNPPAGTVLIITGTQTVTVSYTEGDVTRTANFTITVNPLVLEKIDVTTLPAKTVYFVGEALNLEGMVITATYNDASVKAVTGYTTVPASGAVLNTAGPQIVTVSYTENSITKEINFIVTVNPVVLEKIDVTAMPAKTVYIVGESLNLTGMVVTATYSDTTTKAVTGYTTTPAAGAVLSTVGTQIITVSYSEGSITKDTSFVVMVREDSDEPTIIIGGNSFITGWPVPTTTINIPIKFSCEGNIFEILSAGYSFTIKYDTSILKFVGPVIDAAHMLVMNEHPLDPPGTIRVVCTPMGGLNLLNAFDLLVPFLVIGNPDFNSSTALKLDGAKVIMEDPLDGDYKNVVTRDVIVRFFEIIMGDINGDGIITPEDAILLLQMYVGLIPWTEQALLAGDVNGDGVIDTTDAALILRMVVGG
ncbi:MAG: bacterial Ig-like domain-containing protein [Clostridiales bacterium]|nr:bacterial Ig-like domain-containing protein [Clostridiales bacterium]